ncbi:alpha/beta hydrolase [Nocardioides sp. Kera G14]|uniref:alpha/beta hydrolase n=1 Tax=Nocardioides sp. Kera G14 TaxID=2884264 RepID=UPI001D10AC9C|nr:alpha/beta hydrolase [Nocardioides sp. Kera G14]UDY23137.1 alpha/beta hydrolase [Nocardioides sp. Kera G14]
MNLLSKPGEVAGSVVGGTLSTAERVTFTTSVGLPDPVLRRLVGRPIVVDGQTLAPDVQMMLKLAKVAGPAVESLPIEKGRVALLRQSLLAGGEQRIGKVQTVETDGGKGRLYTPTFVDETQPGPLLVFFHGGGFIYGDLDSHDAAVRFLCEQSGVRVLSVDYRLAPEDPFPAAYDDAVAAFRWAVSHASALGADPTRIGVSGDSAGGNLAAGVALAVGKDCAFQLLIYPVTERTDATTASRKAFAEGFYLTGTFMDLASRNYVDPAAGHDPADPRLAPLYADIPADTAPAFIATAGFDPLRDEGEAYARKLADAGVAVESWRYSDQIHGFFNTIVLRSSRAAVADLAAALKSALA